MSYSLMQKYFLAKRNKADEVVLTLEEAEMALETTKDLDFKLAKAFEFLTQEQIQEIMKL